jgi:hypothetical protein
MSQNTILNLTRFKVELRKLRCAAIVGAEGVCIYYLCSKIRA